MGQRSDQDDGSQHHHRAPLSARKCKGRRPSKNPSKDPKESKLFYNNLTNRYVAIINIQEARLEVKWVSWVRIIESF